MASQEEHLKKLIEIYTRNLQILQGQEGKFAGQAPIHIINQIADTQEKLKDLEAGLKEIGGKLDEPSRADPPPEPEIALPPPPPGTYYTYRIRVANYDQVKVEIRDPNNEIIAEPNGDFGYQGPLRVEIDGLVQTSQLGGLADTRDSKELGGALFKALFDNVLRQDFVNLYQRAVHEEEKLLRIELDVDEKRMPEVASLPWEFMCLPTEANLGSIWLATAPNLIFSRRRAQWFAAKPIQLGSSEKLRIALAVASPENLPAVAYENVQSDLQKLAEKEDRIELLPIVESADPEEIDNLLAQEPHIFHFIGHGRLHEQDGKPVGQIALVDDFDNTWWVDEDYFSGLLNQHRPGVVFLQACEGGMFSASQAFVGVASRVIQQNIPVVVAMQYEVKNSTASRFARRFYQQLAKGDPVDQAAQIGRRSIALGPTQYKSRDFATPVIFIRVRDGHLFQRS